jgi:LPXTG-motif cell wall-anchored protein
VIAQNETPRVIPQTASNMPLLALAGFGLIGLALGIGAFARRMN